MGLKLTYMLTSHAALLHTICICIKICGGIKVHTYAIEVLPVLMSDEYKCRYMCLFIAIIYKQYLLVCVNHWKQSTIKRLLV